MIQKLAMPSSTFLCHAIKHIPCVMSSSTFPVSCHQAHSLCHAIKHIPCVRSLRVSKLDPGQLITSDSTVSHSSDNAN